MGVVQRAGVDAGPCEREDTDEEIRLTIRIPRTGAAKKQRKNCNEAVTLFFDKIYAILQ